MLSITSTRSITGQARGHIQDQPLRHCPCPSNCVRGSSLACTNNDQAIPAAFNSFFLYSKYLAPQSLAYQFTPLTAVPALKSISKLNLLS